MRRRTGFTLIELLAVIAIIALLISILIPSLGRAKEQARRAVCASNLQTIHAAAMAYASQYNDYLPGPPPKPWGNGASGGYLCFDTFWGYMQNGWWIFIENTHRTFLQPAVARCPSMPKTAWHDGFGNGYMLDYDYRWCNFDVWPTLSGESNYNSESYLDPSQTRLSRGNTNLNAVLFAEANGYRRDSGNNVDIYTQSVAGRWAFRWSHLEGGNLVKYNGSVRWMANALDVNWPWANSWPNPGIRTAYNLNGNGLDWLANK